MWRVPQQTFADTNALITCITTCGTIDLYGNCSLLFARSRTANEVIQVIAGDVNIGELACKMKRSTRPHALGKLRHQASWARAEQTRLLQMNLRSPRTPHGNGNKLHQPGSQQFRNLPDVKSCLLRCTASPGGRQRSNTTSTCTDTPACTLHCCPAMRCMCCPRACKHPAASKQPQQRLSCRNLQELAKPAAGKTTKEATAPPLRLPPAQLPACTPTNRRESTAHPTPEGQEPPP